MSNNLPKILDNNIINFDILKKTEYLFFILAISFSFYKNNFLAITTVDHKPNLGSLFSRVLKNRNKDADFQSYVSYIAKRKEAKTGT